MKHIIYSISLFFFAAIQLIAQSPEAVQFQAIVRNGDGDIVANQRVSFEISIVQGSTSGPLIYTETHVDTTDDYGLANLMIGQGTPVTSTFASINWGADEYFVRTSVDISGGTSYTVMGTTQILSVPYALHANEASYSDVANNAYRLNNMSSSAFATHDHLHSEYSTTGHSHSLLPVAYGSIRYDGQLGTRTVNVESCVWSSTYDRYEITIKNGFYYSIDDIAIVTISGAASSCPAGTVARQSSVGGKLLVYIVQSDGTNRQCSFRFVAYQGVSGY